MSLYPQCSFWLSQWSWTTLSFRSSLIGAITRPLLALFQLPDLSLNLFQRLLLMAYFRPYRFFVLLIKVGIEKMQTFFSGGKGPRGSSGGNSMRCPWVACEDQGEEEGCREVWRCLPSDRGGWWGEDCRHFSWALPHCEAYPGLPWGCEGPCGAPWEDAEVHCGEPGQW